MSNLKFGILTDADILKLTKGRKVTNPEDFNLRKGSKSSDSYLNPVPGGLYDSRIFGSIYEDRCNCGYTRTPNLPCPICGSMLLDFEERGTRYAYIDLGVYYTTSVKLPSLIEFLKKNFSIKFIITTDKLKTQRLKPEDWMAYLYLCQFNVVDGKIQGTDELTDENKVALEGIIQCVRELKPELLDELMQYINKLVPVIPAILRKVKYFILDGKKKLKLPKSTAYYRSIIIATDVVRNMSHDDLYNLTLYRANLRTYVAGVLQQMSGFLKSSKSTFLRNEYKINSHKSGRAVISGDPELPIDTIKIPRVLAYEMYKKQFIMYLVEMGYDADKEAVRMYNNPDEVVNNHFDNFCKDKVVLINRPPTLHSQNIQAYKLALSEDYGIHFPLLTTAAQNADFDGDAVMFYAVPDEIKDYVYERCSPSRYTNYVNNDEPILKMRHEILYGLTIATKCLESEDGVQSFNGVQDIIDKFNADEIWVNDKVMIGDRVTSYGRERVAAALKIDNLDDLISKEPINASNVVKLYQVINAMDPDDRVECLKVLQHFSLEVVTLEGATSLDIHEIYYEMPEEYKDQIDAIINSDKSESEKILEAEELHNQMVNHALKSGKGLTNDAITRIKEGNRGKMSAVVDMLVPNFIIDAKGKLQFPKHALVEGLTESEYIQHSIMNRESLATKASLVPFSGYLDRQLKQPGSKIIMLQDKEDEDDLGLALPRKMAVGRTDLDGNLIEENDSDEIVKVRSLLTTNLSYATRDMYSTKYNFTYDNDGRCYLGVNLMTAFIADLTQKGLSLKHGAMNRYVADEYKLIAPVDTEVTMTDSVITLVATGERFIRPTKFTTRGDGFYKKGQIIGEITQFQTISYNIEAIVSIIGAVGNLGQADMSNKLRFSQCFNEDKPAVLELSEDGNTVKLGKMKFNRDDRLYHWPIGTEVPPYTRFCSGLQSLRSMNKVNLNTKFRIFVNQMNELHNANLEILEMVMAIILDDKGKFRGLLRANTSANNSALSALSYGYTTKAVTRIVKGNLNINSDEGGLNDLILTPLFLSLVKYIEE